ncbi:hypothetical protein [Mesorhizobium sp. M2A.F.Ca.ET.029.05.1.1]|nr:hypothetical protein [Mesorhizobium sp. M2A.F.Ca.ET.029.05.1.1]
MTPTVVRFPNEILERVDNLVGQNQRAKFIREAVQAEIEKREAEPAKDSA